MHVVAIKDGQIIGTFLSFPYNLQTNDKIFKGSTVTGLTTAPEFRGQLISQYLVLTMEEQLFINNYDIATFWPDNRKNQSGSSYNIYGSNRMRTEFVTDVRLFLRAYDCKETARAAGAGKFTELLLTAYNLVYSFTVSLSDHLEVKIYERPDIEEICTYLSTVQRKDVLHRQYATEELKRKFEFHSGSLNSVCVVMKKRGNIAGVLFGFTNPVKDQNITYIQVDGLLMDSSLNAHEKKMLMSATDHLIYKYYGCTGAIASASVTNINLGKIGYSKIAVQTFGYNVYNPVLEPHLPQDIQDWMMELR
jgi:hypothetical protein